MELWELLQAWYSSRSWILKGGLTPARHISKEWRFGGSAARYVQLAHNFWEWCFYVPVAAHCYLDRTRPIHALCYCNAKRWPHEQSPPVLRFERYHHGFLLQEWVPKE